MFLGAIRKQRVLYVKWALCLTERMNVFEKRGTCDYVAFKWFISSDNFSVAPFMYSHSLLPVSGDAARIKSCM